MFKKLKQTIAEATAEGAFATAATPSDITPKGSQTTGLYWIIAGISIVFLLYQLYMGLVRPLPPFIAGPIHLCLALIITILSKPLAAKTKMKWTWTIDLLMVACITFIGFYFITNLDRLTYRIMMVDKMLPVDLFCSLALLVIIMEMVRRTLGMNLFIFILLFIAYAFLGQYLTGPFRYSGMTWQQFAEMLTLSTDGIFGSPLSTSVNSLFYFLLFGAFFATCGGGEVLIDCGMKLSDKTAGGPAKAAVVSSGLMGMISGSAVANVTTTGVLTIPLMKRAGYTPEQAGAVESVASTGGQIMPPIMGVGAFIMAEMIGISYANIALSATIPAVAYYVSVFLLVHFIAKKKKLKNEDKAAVKYECTPIIPRLYRLLPIIVVVTMVFTGLSLTTSALAGTALSIIVSMFSKQTRMTFSKLIDALIDGIKQAAAIAIPTGACGIMIGIVVRSGAANKLSKIIAAVGGSNVAVALVIAMIGCLLLGMALPTVAAYLIANILFCPSIMALGVPSLPANMFIFYFGVIAQITPPVCLASFTAAGIAGANSWKTGWTAFGYALVAFLVPYVFVFQPAILLQGTITEILFTSAIVAVGTIFLSASMAGYIFTSIDSKIIRILLGICAVFIIIPESITDVIGVIGGFIIITFCYLKSRKEKSASTTA
ncbi:MAG: TRAP transporter fused permease subunit [Ruminococcaceae bacterium]|nr:TRAP transporter fused permease subunit [Oscillospiraceae bacterium]